MTRAEWWRGAVIYQIYPRSFADSDNDGIGDLPGITARLDHVARLGADAIWLCPFYPSPQADFGYDVSDYTGVDPLFGTLADFDALVARAHALGLKVLIDQVWSHSSDRHAWFDESRRSRSGPLADWYVWADPAPDGTPPNNWLAVFGGSAWTWEPRRRQYYLHHFLPSQPALNLHNPAVLDALLEAGAFWLDRGVDGFRLDALDFMLHDPALRPNEAAAATGETPAKLFALQHHVHDMLQPGTAALLGRIRGLVDRYPGRTTLGEVSSQPGAFERVARYTAGDDRLHMAYTLRPLRGGFDWETVSQLIEQAGGRGGDDGWVCWSFSNHDVERAVSRWYPGPREAPPSPEFARLLIALLLSLRGSVTLYQGEELGLTEAVLDADDLRDPFGIAYWPEFRGRDGSRTPMPWDGRRPHAGFTEGTPWLPVAAAHVSSAVQTQEADAMSLLHDVRRFLAWRRGQPALLHGALHPLPLPAPLVGFVREHEGERVLAAFNLSGAPALLELDGFEGVRPCHQSGFAAEAVDGLAILQPYAAFFARLAPAEARVADEACAFA